MVSVSRIQVHFPDAVPLKSFPWLWPDETPYLILPNASALPKLVLALRFPSCGSPLPRPPGADHRLPAAGPPLLLARILATWYLEISLTPASWLLGPPGPARPARVRPCPPALATVTRTASVPRFDTTRSSFGPSTSVCVLKPSSAVPVFKGVLYISESEQLLTVSSMSGARPAPAVPKT